MFTVTIDSIASDGTNYYLEVRICSGPTTFPLIRPVFPIETSPAEITAYIQTIANNAPTLPDGIAALAGTKVTS